jgi:hypothetical protein
MASKFSYFFLALQERIAALERRIGAETEKVFRYVNHDLGTLDEGLPAISYPAVLIDMSNFRFTDMSSNVQQGQGEVLLKVVFAPYSSTCSLTPLTWKEKGLSYYDMEETLHRALQGWRPEYLVETAPANPEGDPPTEPVVEDMLQHFGALDRASTTTENRRSDLRIRHITYSVAFEDWATKPVVEMADPLPLVVVIDEESMEG